MKTFFILFFAFILCNGQSITKDENKTNDFIFIDGSELTIEGMGWQNVDLPYNRLPIYAKDKVSKDVWRLSRNSAGINIRFLTNSPIIMVNWELNNEMLYLPHMPATGVSGIDLYKKNAQGKWFYFGTGRATKYPENTAKFVNPDSSKYLTEFLLYFPLYNGIKKIQIGIVPGSKIQAAEKNIKLPIVFYGTSITQGGCASRPGLVHTSRIGRELNYPVINLGFSGSAKSEIEMAELLTEIDAALYIYDPLRNMTAELVKNNSENFIRKILDVKRKTPILLVAETDIYNKFPSERDSLLIEIVTKLNAEGYDNVYFLEGTGLLGFDGEGTVDTIHPNDIGFMRMSEKFLTKIREILKID